MNHRRFRPELNRRRFLKTTAVGSLLAGLPAGWVGSAFADDSPESPSVRFGIIALTDCSPIVVAHEKAQEDRREVLTRAMLFLER